jgi:hypothetical protein
MAANKLENSIAQGLMTIGLYTVNFEAMALCFRAKIYEYFQECEPSTIKQFLKECDTAFKTFEFCGPRLASLNVITNDEFDSLTDMRKRRNLFAHEGYNEVIGLTLSDIDADVQVMYSITKKVNRWVVPALSPRPVPKSVRFTISPEFFPGFVSQVARQVVAGPLQVMEPENDT